MAWRCAFWLCSCCSAGSAARHRSYEREGIACEAKWPGATRPCRSLASTCATSQTGIAPRWRSFDFDSRYAAQGFGTLGSSGQFRQRLNPRLNRNAVKHGARLGYGPMCRCCRVALNLSLQMVLDAVSESGNHTKSTPDPTDNCSVRARWVYAARQSRFGCANEFGRWCRHCCSLLLLVLLPPMKSRQYFCSS